MSDMGFKSIKKDGKHMKDIQGGEKKVMKKSLSAIVSLAMAFSMFASVAMAADEVDATKDSSSFSDLKDLDAATKAKFDAMIKAGVFDGVSDGVFGVKDKMNRAQFAKVAALIFQLKVDTSLKTSTFSDVKADDPANGYALPYIEAIYKAGITDGYAPGQFNPAGEVTKEQLAAFLLRGLGKDAEAKATPGISDKTVSDWAKGYVALAIQQKLLSSGADGSFGGTSAATRDLLVLGSYEAKSQYVPPVGPVVTNVSIAKAEAVGAKALKITLNGAIADTSKLTVSVLRGSTVLTGTPKWNDTKNEVTITVDGKFTEGTYTAKIEAVANGGLTVDKGTAEVALQNEKITKIDFVNTSDTVAQGPKVKIAFKALNQYNEQSDLSASRFNIVTSPDLTKESKGDEQALTVNVASAVYNKTLVRDQLFAVTIIAPDNTAQASKTFKVGDVQSVAKVELGDFKYASGKTQIEAGDTVYLDYKAYDQYGFEVTDLATLISGTSSYTTGAGTIASGTESFNYTDWVTNNPRTINVNRGFRFVDDETGDSKPDLKVIAADSDSSSYQLDQDVTLSVVANQSGQTATKTTKIAATKIPYEVSFGSFNKTLAWGDEPQYIPVIAKDKFGTTLTNDELASYYTKHQSDLSIYAYGSSGATVSPTLITSGAHKGSIKISGLDSGTGVQTRKSGSLNINVLVTKSGKSANFNTQVNEYRYPNQIFVSSKAKDQILPNANSAFKLKFKDQYGEELDTNLGNYQLTLSMTYNGSTTDPTAVANSVYGLVAETSTPGPLKYVYAGVGSTPGNTVVIDGVDLKDKIFDKEIKFNTEQNNGRPAPDQNIEGTYQIKAVLKKVKDENGNAISGTEISTVTSIDRIAASKANTDLTYSITSFPNGVYAADKLGLHTNNPGATDNDAKLKNEIESFFYGKLEITAKNGAKTVALPGAKTLISGTNAIGVSNTLVAKPYTKAKLDGTTGTAYGDGTGTAAFDVYALRGIKAGTTSVTVTFTPATGVTKQVTLDNINIVEDGITASSLTAENNGKAKTISIADLTTAPGLDVFNKKTFGDIKVKDQFGNELKNMGVFKAADYIGATFYISDAEWDVTPTTSSITINRSTGKYEYVAGNATLKAFKANVVTANGKTVSVDVDVTP